MLWVNLLKKGTLWLLVVLALRWPEVWEKWAFLQNKILNDTLRLAVLIEKLLILFPNGLKAFRHKLRKPKWVKLLRPCVRILAKRYSLVMTSLLKPTLTLKKLLRNNLLRNCRYRILEREEEVHRLPPFRRGVDGLMWVESN